MNNKDEVIKPNPVNNEIKVINKKDRFTTVIAFFIIIMIGVFIYYLDDIIDYYNENYGEVNETQIKNDASYNLEDGYFIIDNTSSYKLVKDIKFSNVRKSSNNSIAFSYTSTNNYNKIDDLNIFIEIYNKEKVLIHNEQFKTNESLELNSLKQYFVVLDNEKYNNAYYALILSK